MKGITSCWKMASILLKSVLVLSCVLSFDSFGQLVGKKMTVRSATATFVVSQQASSGLYKWDSGFLLHYVRDPDAPVIWVYDRAGKLASNLTPLKSLPGVQAMNLVDVAITKKNTILAGGILVKGGQMASALLEFDMAGRLKRTIKTDPFAVLRLAVDGDDAIWLLGYDWQRRGKDYDWTMVHKLSPEGVILKSALPRSLLPKEREPFNVKSPDIESAFVSFQIVGSEVHVWLPGVDELVLLNLDGQVVQQIKSPFGAIFGPGVSIAMLSFSVTPQGDWVTVARSENSVRWLFSPDLGQSWSAVALQADPRNARLVGFTQSAEAVLIRIAGIGSVEFCPIAY